MFLVNEYFDCHVKSIGFETADGPATLGVIAPGTYEFGTTRKEIMQVISGRMAALLPDRKEWMECVPGQAFEVEAGRKFSVRVSENASYICLYL